MKYAIQAKVWVGDKHVFDVMLNASPRSLSSLTPQERKLSVLL
jgi:hypothetical protein